MVDELCTRFGASERQVCALLKLSRSVYYYRSVARDSTALTLRIREISKARVHYGYRRVHVLLKRQGWPDNHKRVYRLYREEGPSLRHKRPRRHKTARIRQPTQQASGPNQIWSMDFVSDALFDGRRLRALTVVDQFTRECLAIEVGQSLKREDVARTMDYLAATRGTPQTIKVDNGSEFAGRVMDRWAYERGVELDFSRPGKPTDNAFVESFNGRLREECLNAHWFLSLDDARGKIEAWRCFYNEARPHSALGWLTPAEFARQYSARGDAAAQQEPDFSTNSRS